MKSFKVPITPTGGLPPVVVMDRQNQPIVGCYRKQGAEQTSIHSALEMKPCAFQNLNNALTYHGIGNFDESGDVGAVDIIAG